MAYVEMQHMHNGELFEDFHVNTLIDNVAQNRADLLNKQDKINDLATIRSGASNGTQAKTTITQHAADSTVHTTAADKNRWDNKQDAIGNLSTIESNAAEGHTAKGLIDNHVVNTVMHVTSAEREAWNAKQNAIDDLSTIRSNAALGASSIQGVKVDGTALTPDENGVVNIEGAVGPQGPEGPQGPQGLAGADGRQGVDGEPGSRWWNGATQGNIVTLGVEDDMRVGDVVLDGGQSVSSRRGNVYRITEITGSGLQSAQAASNGTWVSKDITELQVGDTVMIVMAATVGDPVYFVLEANGSSSPKATGVSITPSQSGYTFDSEVVDAYKFTFNVDNNYYKFQQYETENSYLYAGNSNSGVRVGNPSTAAWAEWNMDSSGYLRTDGTTSPRFLGVYNQTDWRSYTNTTGNIAYQSFIFFVYEESPVPPTPTRTVYIDTDPVTNILGPSGNDGQDGVGLVFDWSGTELGIKREGAPNYEYVDLQGPEGPQGEQGPAGADGSDGADGQNGSDGSDGASAYEIAVEHGYEGTEEEWLASLKGEQGETGATGATGAQGPQGPQGPEGPNPTVEIQDVIDLLNDNSQDPEYSPSQNN